MTNQSGCTFSKSQLSERVKDLTFVLVKHHIMLEAKNQNPRFCNTAVAIVRYVQLLGGGGRVLQ